MTGQIIKGISGFYYVETQNGIYECKAKGIFRKQKIKPVVGDMVSIEVTDPINMKGNVTSICERSSYLYRPVVSNVDRALIVFSISYPTPNLHLLDRFLVIMQKQKIPCAIALSKCDLDSTEVVSVDEFVDIYEKAGYKVFPFSSVSDFGIDAIRAYLRGGHTVISGPSGVGKSTLINKLQNSIVQETSDISRKLNRGKNTTRHSVLIHLDDESFIIDTPGFTSFELFELKSSEIREYFPEFKPYNNGSCYYSGCTHISEPDCAVKDALGKGEISGQRYESYCEIFADLKSHEKY